MYLASCTLAIAGLVEITKEFVGKKPRTVVRLSALGRDAIERHWQQLDAIRQAGQERAALQIAHGGMATELLVQFAFAAKVF